jgi:hypothetical protein
LTHEGRFQETRNVSQGGIMPPGHPFLVIEMAIERGTLLQPYQVSKGGQRFSAGIQSKLLDTTGKVPHAGIPHDALILSLQYKEVEQRGFCA